MSVQVGEGKRWTVDRQKVRSTLKGHGVRTNSLLPDPLTVPDREVRRGREDARTGGRKGVGPSLKYYNYRRRRYHVVRETIREIHVRI